MTANILEQIVKMNMPDMHDYLAQRKEDVRDRADLKESVRTILQNNGHKDFERSWGEQDWNGNLIKYPATYTYEFDKMIPGYPARFIALPVRINDRGMDDEIVELLVVNQSTKKVYTAFNSGNRNIHYHGKLNITPLSIREIEGVIQVAYEIERTPQLKEFTGTDFYEMIHRLFTTGTTKEREIAIANVKLEESEK